MHNGKIFAQKLPFMNQKYGEKYDKEE